MNLSRTNKMLLNITTIALLLISTFLVPIYATEFNSRTQENILSNKIRPDVRIGIRFNAVSTDNNGGIFIGGTDLISQHFLIHLDSNSSKVVTSPDLHYINDLFFLNSQDSWAIMGGGLYKSNNGGYNWQPIKEIKDESLDVVYFVDSSNGWVAGWGGSMYRTRNGGNTWEKLGTGINYNINHLRFIDSKHGWITGSKSIDESLKWNHILATTDDSGETWEITTEGSSIGAKIPHIFWLIDNNKGLAIDGTNNIIYTENSGETWTIQKLSDNRIWESLFFLNDLEGWAVGSGILHTQDGGKTWKYQLKTDGSPGQKLEQIIFVNKNVGWAIGKSTILSTTNGGKSWSNVTKKLEKKVDAALVNYEN